LKILKL